MELNERAAFRSIIRSVIRFANKDVVKSLISSCAGEYFKGV